MALSPADFYAYSNATGTPYPESAEDRAYLAPEVLEFRRNQLKAPQQESNILQTIGAAVLGLGALGAAGVAGRKAYRALRPAGKSATAGVRQVDLTEYAKNIPELTRVSQEYRPAPSKTLVQDLTSLQQSQQANIVDQKINAVESGEDQVTGRVKHALQQDPHLDMGQVEVLEDVEQSKNLSSTSASRFMEAERNKISQEMATRGVAPMSQDVERELARRLGSEASSYGPKYTARRQALELFAKTGNPIAAETTKRFGLSPVTFETFENMPPAKQKLFETSAPMSLEGYPSEEIIAVIPKTGIEVDVPGVGRVDISTLRKPVITEDTALSADEFIEGRKASGQDWLAGISNEIEPQRNEILNERRTLIENQAATITPRLEQAQAAGDAKLAKTLEAQLNSLRYQYKNPQSHPHRRDDLNLLNARLAGAERKIAADVASLEKKFPTTLSDWSGESNRVFGELDPDTGEFIPETMELRTERRTADLGEKGGGGRKVAEYTGGEALVEEVRAIQGGGRYRDYDPETGAARVPWSGDKTQTGREIDAYGVRLSSQGSANPERRPTEVTPPDMSALPSPYSRLDNETLGQMSTMGSESERYNALKELGRRNTVGQKPILGGPQPTQAPQTQVPTAERKKSIDVSEEMRRIRQSAPPEKAQKLINQYLNNLRGF